MTTNVGLWSMIELHHDECPQVGGGVSESRASRPAWGLSFLRGEEQSDVPNLHEWHELSLRKHISTSSRIANLARGYSNTYPNQREVRDVHTELLTRLETRRHRNCEVLVLQPCVRMVLGVVRAIVDDGPEDLIQVVDVRARGTAARPEADGHGDLLCAALEALRVHTKVSQLIYRNKKCAAHRSVDSDGNVFAGLDRGPLGRSTNHDALCECGHDGRSQSYDGE